MVLVQLFAYTGRADPDDGRRQVIEPTPVDHLANIADAMRGERRVRTQVVLARLAGHNHHEYEHWTFQHLRAALADHGISVVKTGGVKVIRAEDITGAMKARPEALDDGEVADDKLTESSPSWGRYGDFRRDVRDFSPIGPRAIVPSMTSRNTSRGTFVAVSESQRLLS